MGVWIPSVTQQKIVPKQTLRFTVTLRRNGGESRCQQVNAANQIQHLPWSGTRV